MVAVGKGYDSRKEAEAARSKFEAALRAASPADVVWKVTVVIGGHGQKDGWDVR